MGGSFFGVLALSAFASSFSHAADLNFNDLESILIAQKITSIEDALPVLTAKYPDYFTFQTLMYNSQSLQESTFIEPRVLVFGPSARFVLAFNANPNRRGGGSFETVEYADATHEFLYREIAFKYPGFDKNKLNLKPSEIAFENQALLVSTPNPGKCTQCHGQPARPIWGTYFLWPGAYGSDDDDLGLSFDRESWNANNEVFFQGSTRPQSQGRNIIFKAGLDDGELAGMVQYLKQRPNHPRYKFLPPLFIEPGVLRYSQGVPFDQLDYSTTADQERQRLNVGYSWPSRPNSFLQEGFFRLNQDRLIWKLGQAGLKDAFKSDFWQELFQFERKISPSPETMWTDLATEISKGFAGFKFLGQRPTTPEIALLLKQNFTDEITNQREKMAIHQSSFAPDSLRFFPYPSSTDVTRYGMEWLGDTEKFYKQFLGLETVSETDRIAFHLETDDQVVITVLQILLKDRGVDLRSYSLNMHQQSLSFHDGGLVDVARFLGMSEFAVRNQAAGR